MTDFYKYFKIEYYAEDAEIRKVLDIFYRDLQKHGGTEEQYRVLREAQDTLLNPIKRAEYDEKLNYSAPPRADAAVVPVRADRRALVVLLAAAAVLLAVLAVYLPGRIKGVPLPVISPGVYLVSVSTGEKEAVLRKFDPEHVFPDGGKREGYEILVIGGGAVEWVTKDELQEGYRAGEYAPRDLTGN